MSNRQDFTVDESGLAALAERVLAGEGAPEGELSLSFVSTDEMEQLHERYAGEDGPTDVLAFPMGEEGMLGDVVICPAEARRNNEDVEEELRLLVVHGTLHLLGHDHEDEDARRKMWSKQERYSSVRLEGEQ
ncbi:MAG TPA: rRNA maturation RNase YbeY [Actinomycetota bacterium]